MNLQSFARERIKTAAKAVAGGIYNGDKDAPIAPCDDKKKHRSGPMLATNDKFNPIGYNVKQRAY